MNYSRKNIRNFAIIAHIDHGKSTLADRIMEMTGLVTSRESKDRMLDTLELEQERGITIKMQTARMEYMYKGSDESFTQEDPYTLNLVDTPGHVDFAYEVSRSLAAAEGAILLVDATQGIQAQTLTTVYKAFEYDLEIIPVINKVDLPSAEVERVTESLVTTFGFKEEEILHTSGKTGMGVPELLDAIVERIPAPMDGNEDSPLRALIYDSFYHEHKGVVALVKIVDGELKKDQEIAMIGTETTVEPPEIGYVLPKLSEKDILRTGQIGYIATGLKDISNVHAGDTVTIKAHKKEVTALPGYQPPKPMVFASLYPIDADDFPQFQEALEKLALNDPALVYTKEHSQALGSGFNCGFLGLLHLEITQERLEREFDIDLITTLPSVEYKIKLTTSDFSKLEINVANMDEDNYLHIKNAAEYPDQTFIDEVQEPWVDLEVVTPEEYIGSIMELCSKHRGEYKKMEYLSGSTAQQKHVLLKYDIPSAEIIASFFDTLKSISQGYASMDYTQTGYRVSDVVKVSMVINYEPIEALSFLTHRDNAERIGREVTGRLKDLIPRQQFKIPIQASIGARVIARETIAAYRKDVTAKLYGGDISRKKKLLSKQKKGKKRMKQFGSVELPKDVFIKALRTD